MSLKLICGGVLGLSLLAAFSTGVIEGREGNDFLRSDNSIAADSIYTATLASDQLEPWVRARLQNNLGLAQTHTNRFRMADSSFTCALLLEARPKRRAAMAYNAGTAALQADRLDAAIAHLRRSLILAPDDSLARRNIEIALRRQDPNTEHSTSPKSPEPSEFAQRTKVRADSLVRQQRYLDALDLMRSGAEQDSTVLAFGEFMERLEGVVRIDTTE